MTPKPVAQPILRRQRGVAMVAVLWVVAALSILVTGLVQTQREEIRNAASSRLHLQAEAVGQGAIHLALQALLARDRRADRLSHSRITYGGVDVVVEVQPFSGLVDFNLAPAPLLAALFAGSGGVDPVTSQRLAAAVVAVRDARPAEPPPRFKAPEELLNVEGISYDLYARLAHLLTTDTRGSGRINPLAASQEVLLLLADGDQGLANQVAADRDADAAGIDTTRLQTAFTDNSASGRLRFRADVPFPDGSRVTVVRDIDISPVAEGKAPWRTLRAHAPVLSPK